MRICFVSANPGWSLVVHAWHWGEVCQLLPAEQKLLDHPCLLGRLLHKPHCLRDENGGVGRVVCGERHQQQPRQRLSETSPTPGACRRLVASRNAVVKETD